MGLLAEYNQILRENFPPPGPLPFGCWGERLLIPGTFLSIARSFPNLLLPIRFLPSANVSAAYSLSPITFVSWREVFSGISLLFGEALPPRALQRSEPFFLTFRCRNFRLSLPFRELEKSFLPLTCLEEASLSYTGRIPSTSPFSGKWLFLTAGTHLLSSAL